MNSIRAFWRSFLGLRGKLTLTYTAVTVSAMLAIEILGILSLLTLNAILGYPEGSYIQDVIYVLYPRAAAYLETDPPDLEGLQAWTEATYAAGYASLPPTNWSDSPAARIAEPHPMYVVARDGTIVAAAPQHAHRDIGQPYIPPNIEGADFMLAAAQEGHLSVGQLYGMAPDGTFFVIVPVLHRISREPIGMITLYVEQPPSWLLTFGPTVVRFVLVTAFLLILGITPFGALFGFIMSRGLTRRLKSLSQAADAWSHGDFSVMPKDRGRDELGDLQNRLIHMATQLESLLQTRQELAGLEERNSLARELHDTVKQQVFAAIMQLRAAKNLVDDNPDALKRHLAETEKLLKVSQNDLTLIINEMRPAALEGQSLVTALRSYLDMWSQHTGIKTDLQVQGERSLSVNIERALYRVAQESLANTARHSQATHVAIHLRYAADFVTLSLEDNGRGFDLTQPETTGFGLQSMQQRVTELGGTLTISSKPGVKTTLWAEIPVHRRSP